jgi:hypothetical protein
MVQRAASIRNASPAKEEVSVNAVGNETFSRPVYSYPEYARYEGAKDRLNTEGFKRVVPKKEQ